MSFSGPNRTVRTAVCALLALTVTAAVAPAASAATTQTVPVGAAQAAEDEVRDFVGVGGDAINGGVHIAPEATIRPVAGSNALSVRVVNHDTETVHISIESEYGSRSIVTEPGRVAYVSFNLRQPTVPTVFVNIVGQVLDEDGEMVRSSGFAMMNVILP